MAEVKIVRLLGNQDVIAKVHVHRDKDRTSYRLTDVHALMVVPEEVPQSDLAINQQPARQKLSIQLYPFLAVYMNGKKSIDLDQFHVLFLADPTPGILDYYNQKTSGLILPPSADSISPLCEEELQPAPDAEVPNTLENVLVE